VSAPGSGRLVVFDAFGTLFDPSSLVERLRVRFGEDGLAIGATWRATQLRYTWLRTLMDAYEPFDVVTRDALAYAVRSHGQGSTDGELDELARGYSELEAYTEVPEVLGTLVDDSVTLAILSNGTSAMLGGLAERAGIAARFAVILSVDSVRRYKPDPAVYRLATDHFGVAAADVGFVSGNAWDCSGARRFGFDVTWIARSDGPFDELGEQPDHVGRDLRVLLDPSA